MSIICHITEYRSPLQLESIALRRRILRIPLGLDFNKKDLEEEKDQVHIIALDDKQVVGILILVKQTDNSVKMRQVAVDEYYQNRGIGKKLVVFSELWALENGFNTMVLHARKKAVPFYLSLNYLADGPEFTEVGIPHVKMTKRLDEHLLSY